MEQFGGTAGTKDEQLEMMQNPMVVQMQQMQARLDKKNQEVVQAEAKEREDASEARQDHISALQGDRDKLQEELEKLKAELALASSRGAPMPAVALAVSTPGGSAGVNVGRPAAKREPARADFETGRPGQRKKKDVD